VIPLKDNIRTDRLPFVTIGLIVLNFVAYILAVSHGGSFISGPDLQEVVKFGLIPKSLTHPGFHCVAVTTARGEALGCRNGPLPGSLPAWQTIFTSMFMHASILHIGGNMLFLWIFGNNVEDAMGHVKYLCSTSPAASRRWRCRSQSHPPPWSRRLERRARSRRY
jgi:membrane associated rhomboid family serine protease